MRTFALALLLGLPLGSLARGVTRTNTNPNLNYTLDGKPPGADAVRPAKAN